MIDEDIIGNFSSVLRFSGTHLVQKETVPDHSVEMAFLCINFSELVSESNKEELAYRCLIHDFEESITSDIPRPIKHRNPGIKRIIDEEAYKMLSELCGEEFTDEVFNAKSKDNVNGFLVHIADRIQCFRKMKREVETYGNKSLSRDFEVFKRDIYTVLDEIPESTLMSEISKENLLKYLKQLILK